MSTEALRVLAKTRAFTLLAWVAVGDLHSGCHTYMPVSTDYSAWMYSWSIILRAPGAGPNLHRPSMLLLDALLDHLFVASHIVKHPGYNQF